MLQGCCKLRAAVQRIRPLSRLDLGVLRDDLQTLGLGERLHRSALRGQPKPAAGLRPGGDTVVGNDHLWSLFRSDEGSQQRPA